MASAGTAYVDVEAKLDSFASDLDAAISGLTAEVPITADTSEVDAALSSIEAAPVDVGVNADTGEAQGELDALEADPIDVPVAVDTAAAEEQIAGLGGAFEGLASDLGPSGGALSNFAGSLAGVAGASSTAVVGLGLAAVSVGYVVSQAAEAQVVLAQTEQLLTTTGTGAYLTSGAMSDLAGEIQRYSGMSDEAVLAGQNMLLTLENVSSQQAVSAGVFERTTKLGADMATMMGTDVTSAMRALGRAVDDPTAGMSRLRRANIQLTESEKDHITSLQESGDMLGAQQALLDAVEGRVGGLANAYGNTLAGRLDITKEKFGELAEAIGTGFLPIVEAVATAAGGLADLLSLIPEPLLTAAMAFGTMRLVLPLVAGGLSSVATSAYVAAGGVGTFAIAAQGAQAMAAGLTAAIGPVALATAGLYIGYQVLTKGVKEEEKAMAESAERIAATAALYNQDLSPVITTTADRIRELKADNDKLNDAFKDAGLSAEEFAQFVAGAGDITATSSAGTTTLTDDILALASAATRSGGDFQTISRELISLNDELQQAARSSLDVAAASERIPQAVIDAAIDANTVDGTVNYVAALNDAYRATVNYVFANGLAIDSSGRVVEAFGLAGSAAEQFGQDTLDGISTSLTAIADLNDNGQVGLREFATSIALNAANISNFVANVDAIAGRGFPQLAAALFELGPQYATAAAQAGTMSDSTLSSFNALVTGAISMKDLTAAEAIALRDELTAALGADVAGPLLDDLESIPSAASNATSATDDVAEGLSVPEAGTKGQTAGQNWGAGVMAGIGDTTAPIAAKATTAATPALAIIAAGNSGRIAGQNWGAGVVGGLRDAETAIDNTANSITSNAGSSPAAYKRGYDIGTAYARGVTNGMATAPQPRAAGGPVTSSGSYLVGEQGPELFVPRTSGTIIPATATAAMTAGKGSTYNVTVNAAGGTDGHELARLITDELRKLERAGQ